MLMVVFGAGASFDSYTLLPALNKPNVKWRPPLAVELFSRDELYEHVAEFPECQPIVSRLAVLPGGISLEEELEKLQNEAFAGDMERDVQLMATRYYLQYVIYNLQNHWTAEVTKGVSNYKDFLDQIRVWRFKTKQTEPVCLVTFNYDFLLEDAVWGMLRRGAAETLTAYTNTDYKVFKLHGSVDWGREVDTTTPYVVEAVRQSGWSTVRAMISDAPMLEVSDRYRIVRAVPMSSIDGKIGLVPAIAIPIQRKDDYQCPQRHVDMLEEFLPKVDRVIVIGWRGREERFVKAMADKLPNDTRTLIVSRSLESAAEVGWYLHRSGYPSRIGIAGDGFTGFVLKDQFQNFLAWNGDGELRLS